MRDKLIKKNIEDSFTNSDEDTSSNISIPKDSKKIRHTSQILKRKGEHKQIVDTIIMMLSSNTMPYYAEFSTFMNFFESTNIPTCGVNVTKEGMNFYWNRKFVDSLTMSETMFLLIHEVFHLLFDHTKRSIYYNHELSNICQDMIINQIILDDIVKKINSVNGVKTDVISIPKIHDEFIIDEDGNIILDENGNKIPNPNYQKNTALFIDKKYKGEPIFENLYEWMKEEQEDYRKRKKEQKEQQGQGQSGQGQGQSGDGQSSGDVQGESQGGQGEKDSFGNPSYGPYGQGDVECNSLDSIFDNIEKGKQLTLDSHIEDDIQQQGRKSVINDFMQRLKNRGLVSGEVEATLNKLRKTKKDYLKEIKRTISNHIVGSSKRKSIVRPNRRGLEGIKGKKKYKNVINVILDTSGSMSGDFEKVLSYIFQNDIQINLIQIDTAVKEIKEIKNKRELQKVVIHGMGGTILQPAIEYVSEIKNKLFNFNTLILTDGYTDTLDFTKINTKTLILSTGTKPSIVDIKGNVKIIIIDTKNSLYGD